MAVDEVTSEFLERQLAAVRAGAAGEREGLFGPDSLTWRIDREAAIFLGAGRALLLQLAHPFVATAIVEHSRAGADPIGRFHRTFSTVYAMVFGTLGHALAASRALHNRHAAVTGMITADIGPFAAGSPYRANDVAALRWVFATLIDTAVMAHDLMLPALDADEREHYYTESKTFAALFGLAHEDVPADWTAFAAYNETMTRSDTLTIGTGARGLAHELLSGAGMLIGTPRWYRALTAALLPERLRGAFALPFGEHEQRSAARAIARLRRLYPHLPARLRYVGPYQEALARLDGKKPDALTQLLNRVWIGRPRLEDGA